MAWRRAVAFSLALTLVGAGAQWPAPPAASAAPVAAPEPAAEVTALREAKETGRPAEVAGRTTETAKLSATPQGTFVLETSPVPVRAERGGAFRDVDLTLERRADGSVGPKVSAASVSFGGGGDETLATMSGGGRALTLTWPGGTLPEPVLDGPNATYVDAGGPGIDLLVTATPTGMAHYVVVKTPQAARDPDLAKIEFGVRAPGLRLREHSDGAVSAVDAGGKEIFTAPKPQMWEGATPPDRARRNSPDPDAVSAGPVPGADARPMDVEITDGRIAVVPDGRLLKSADTGFPVVIDPSWQVWNATRETDGDGYGSGDSGWAYVDQTWPDSAYWKPTRLPTGRETEDYTDKRSFIRMNTDKIHQWSGDRKVKINNVAITFDTQHAWSCEARDVRLFNVEHVYSTTTWETRPGAFIPSGSGWSTNWLATKTVADKGRPECGDGAEANDVVFSGGNLPRLVQWATDHGWDFFTLGLYPDPDYDDAHTWKVFDPDPRMAIEFSRYPDAPSGVHMTNGGTTEYPCVQGEGRPWLGASQDRRLRAALKDVDGDNAGGYDGQALRGRFELHQEVVGADGTTTTETWNRYYPEDADPDDGPWEMADAGTGKLAAYTVMSRQDQSATADGGTFYRWRVQAEDDTRLSGVWSSWCEFMVDGKPPKTPAVTVPGYPQGRWSGYDSANRAYKPADFTFGPGGSGDVVKYRYKFADGTEDTETVAMGESVSFSWTPKRFGWQWVEVTSYDRAGNPSPTVKYEFGVQQPPRDAGWSMDDTGGNVARAVGQTGTARPGANLVLHGNPVQGEPGNRGSAVPADKSVKFNGTDQYGTVNPVLDTGTGGETVPLADTGKRFMFSAWARPDATTGDRVVAAQTAADGSVFELGWIGGRWSFRHRAPDGTVLAQATRSQAAPANGSAWTDNWVSLMAGYDPIRQEVWLRTQAPDARSPDCVRDFGEEFCDPEPVLDPATVTASDTWTPAAGQGALLVGATATGGGRGSYWNGRLDDLQLWPLAHPDETVLRVVYGETVQDQQFAGSTLRLVNVNSGHCLDVDNGGTANGTNVMQWHCNASAAQNWRFTDVGGGYYTLTNPNSGKCLDVDGTDGSGTADGLNVWQYECNGSQGQQWKPEHKPGGYQLRSRRSDKCLSVGGSATWPGGNAIQWSCTDLRQDQLWNITRQKRHEFDGINYRLEGLGGGKCLEIAGASTEPGANVMQWDCNGGNWQNWTFHHLGDGYYSLTNVGTGLCLEVAGGWGVVTPGANVAQWHCLRGEPHQSWKVVPVGDDGNQGYRLIAKHSGLVLSVSGASTAAGANVVQDVPQEPAQQHQVWKLGCGPGDLYRCNG